MPVDNEQWRVAYHEAGHATVALVLTECGRVKHITIVQEGDVLGQVFFTKEFSFKSATLDALRAGLAMSFGGPIGEEIGTGSFDNPGIDPDFETQLAHLFALGVRFKLKSPQESDAAKTLARRIITQQDTLFRAIASTLVEKRKLNRADLLALRDQHLVTP